MSATQPWHATTLGRACCVLGSIKLAVPVMVLVTAAMIWGTYIESADSAQAAKAMVYGSWWFVALMALVCVILVAAVITRFPWRRKHTGFMVVHASLVLMIFGGMWSLFARVEGQLLLQESDHGSLIEKPTEQIELLLHEAGQMLPEAAARVDAKTTGLTLGSISLEIVDRWDNIAQRQVVRNDGANPLQAVEVSADPHAEEGMWIGELPAGQSWPRLGSVPVRVVPAGEAFDPASVLGDRDVVYEFVHSGHRHRLAEVGQEAVEGWTIESIEYFERGNVTPDGLAEAEDDRDNPAVQVVLRNESGARERHMAFEQFPDMPISRLLEGSAGSGAALVPTTAGAGHGLVFQTTDSGSLTITEIAADGTVTVHEQPGDLPWSLQFGVGPLTVLRHFDRARAVAEIVEAPKADSSRPAIVVRVAGATEPAVLPWKGPTPVETDAGVLLLRYGPETAALPFTVRLDEFRKLDYPGTAMAMAYESDVTVTLADGSTEGHRIYMNNPFAHDGWKLYQSGFIGEDVSIFSVMKDPGLGLTYLGCTGLCVGLFLTFFAGGLSWGHPGIPVAFARKEPSDAAQAADADAVDDDFRPVAGAEVA